MLQFLSFHYYLFKIILEVLLLLLLLIIKRNSFCCCKNYCYKFLAAELWVTANISFPLILCKILYLQLKILLRPTEPSQQTHSFRSRIAETVSLVRDQAITWRGPTGQRKVLKDNGFYSLLPSSSKNCKAFWHVKCSFFNIPNFHSFGSKVKYESRHICMRPEWLKESLLGKSMRNFLCAPNKRIQSFFLLLSPVSSMLSGQDPQPLLSLHIHRSKRRYRVCRGPNNYPHTKLFSLLQQQQEQQPL